MAYIKRSDTQRFLVGHISDTFPDKDLPTRRDVLKYLLHKKHRYQTEHKGKSPPLKELVCCPLKSKSNDAKCDEEGGCLPADRCVVRGVKEAWVKAGLPTVTDVCIRY